MPSSAGLPGFLVPLFVEFAAKIRAGALAVASDDLQTLLGRPATGLPEALGRELLIHGLLDVDGARRAVMGRTGEPG